MTHEVTPSYLSGGWAAILALVVGGIFQTILSTPDLQFPHVPHNPFFLLKSLTLQCDLLLSVHPLPLSGYIWGIHNMKVSWCKWTSVALCLGKSSTAGMIFLNCVYLLAPWCESASHQLHINLVGSLRMFSSPSALANLWLLYLLLSSLAISHCDWRDGECQGEKSCVV